MKKILAIVLASVMVLACGAVLFVSAGEAENVAPKATYTLHEVFRMGGKEDNYGYVATADISYPDEGGKTLTDGLHAESTSYGDTAWVGLNQSHPDFKDTAKPLYVDFEPDLE